MRIGSQVQVKHGVGQIVGKDLPESQSVWRWIVRVDQPIEEFAEMVARFDGARLCYFPEQVTAL